MRGKFITFEGSEGSGKSTQIRRLYSYLKRKKKNVLFIREPGGVKISEKIRDLLLDVKNQEMCTETEVMLYMAARAQLVAQVIEPALKKGRIVLCDRFLDSTIAYQGYGSGADVGFIKYVGNVVTRGFKPDLTFFFDINAQTGLSRIKRSKDRIERRAIAFHNRVRNGYVALAKSEPKRIKLIPSQASKDEIYAKVKSHIDKLFKFKN